MLLFGLFAFKSNTNSISAVILIIYSMVLFGFFPQLQFCPFATIFHKHIEWFSDICFSSLLISKHISYLIMIVEYTSVWSLIMNLKEWITDVNKMWMNTWFRWIVFLVFRPKMVWREQTRQTLNINNKYCLSIQINRKSHNKYQNKIKIDAHDQAILPNVFAICLAIWLNPYVISVYYSILCGTKT